MSLEDAIEAYAHVAATSLHPREDRGEWDLISELGRRTSRKGNTVVTFIAEGEFVWGGSVEDPIYYPYQSTYEVVFSPTGEVLQTRVW